MEATAKFDYEAAAADELSFRKGELLVMVQTSGDWLTAERGGCEGLVPKNFISIHLPSWYQEASSRRAARDQLMGKPEGSFLIRRSSDGAQRDFSISVRCEADVQHFKVLRDSRGRYYLWMEKFPSLNQLVEYYKYTSISKNSPIFLQEEKQQQQQQQPPQQSRRGSDSSPPHGPPSPPHGPPSRPPAPPTPTHGPPTARQVRALYCFAAEEKDELEFGAGDVIEVVEWSDPVWWRGRLGRRTGLFPSNYTEPL
ncbi:GRB2-related adapter protein 2b [Gasterosteus aculeatus]